MIAGVPGPVIVYVTPASVVTCAVASHKPLQLTSVDAVKAIIGAFGFDKVIFVVDVHPFTSVAVTT